MELLSVFFVQILTRFLRLKLMNEEEVKINHIYAYDIVLTRYEVRNFG